MKRTLCECDACGARDALEVTVVVGRCADPSGHGYEASTDTVDLCPACLVRELRGVLGTLHWTAVKDWVAEIRKKGRAAADG